MDEERYILNELKQYSGSATFTRDPFNKCVTTEGFDRFIELCKCHWLFSDYAIEIMLTDLKREDFFVLKITRKGHGVVVSLEDGNSNILHQKECELSDFPLSTFEFFIAKNELGSFTFMLKNEY